MKGHIPEIGIRKLHIKNFRNISELELDFCGLDDSPTDIAVIAGPNGSGKTSVLEACLLALGFTGDFQRPTDERATQSGQSSWEITAELRITPYETLYEFYPSDLQVRITQNGQSIERSSSQAFTQQLFPIPSIYFSSWRAPNLVGALPITAGRPGKRPDDTDANRLRRTKQYLINLKAYGLMGGGRQTNDPHSFQSEIDRLNAAWQQFYPQADAQFTIKPKGDDPEEGFDLFLAQSGQTPISVDNLSSGQLELICFFGGLIVSKFDAGVIVIDEPELHLDPQWHALLLQTFRGFVPRAQFIVATHSPRVFDSVYSFQRHFLAADKDPRVWAGSDSNPIDRNLA